MQRQFIYITNTPQYDIRAFQIPELYEVTAKPEEGLVIKGWFVPPSQDNKPVLVFFHGNASNLGVSMTIAPAFIKHGYGFLVAEYRGYSGNAGKPTEENLYQDARAWLHFLSGKGYEQTDIVLFGESLGSGIAVQMATEFQDIQGIVLFSPYTALNDVAQKHYPLFPVKWLMHDKYESAKKIKQIKKPVFIIHGDKDTIVPVEHGRRLFSLANDPKEIKIISGGGHNDLYMLGASNYILSFLNSL